MELGRAFLGIYERLPRFLKAIISRLYYSPELGKGVYLLGWIIFSKGVKIGDYTYINTNEFIRNVEIGKFCCIAANLRIGLYEHPCWQFSGYDFFDTVSPLRKYKLLKKAPKMGGERERGGG